MYVIFLFYLLSFTKHSEYCDIFQSTFHLLICDAVQVGVLYFFFNSSVYLEKARGVCILTFKSVLLIKRSPRYLVRRLIFSMLK